MLMYTYFASATRRVVCNSFATCISIWVEW